MDSVELYTVKIRIIITCFLGVLITALFAGAWSIPFLFESSSILYKFGIQKIYLRSGKIVGITVAVLVFLQIVLAFRFAPLLKIVSLKRLIGIHRANGICLSVFILLHPLLILASEGFTLYQFEKRYWPEFVGIGLLGFIVLYSAAAFFRNAMGFPYAQWLLTHRIGALLVVIVMQIHILNASESFKAGLPRIAVLTIGGINLLMLAGIWVRRLSKNT